MKYTVKKQGLLPKFMPTFAKILLFYKEMLSGHIYIVIYIEFSHLMHLKV